MHCMTDLVTYLILLLIHQHQQSRSHSTAPSIQIHRPIFSDKYVNRPIELGGEITDRLDQSKGGRGVDDG
jgi:hypothetical protein